MEPHEPLTIAAGLPELEFRSLGDFDAGHVGVYRTDGPGAGPWERHPENEELLHVLAGRVVIDVLTDDGRESITLTAGQVLLVPRGHWHRHRDAVQLTELYVTPGPTEHSMAEDPRTA